MFTKSYLMLPPPVSTKTKPFTFDQVRACRLNVDVDRELMSLVKKRNSNVNRELQAAIKTHLDLNA